MTDQEVITQLSEADVFAMTLFGEARSEGREGIGAVADVIRNRVKSGKYGEGYRGVCLRPWQFSCWIPAGGRENYELVIATASTLQRDRAVAGAALRRCLAVARDTMADRRPDTVMGATHYITEALWRDQAKRPSWVRGVAPVCQVGAHVFFVLEKG